MFTEEKKTQLHEIQQCSLETIDKTATKLEVRNTTNDHSDVLG